MIVQIYFFIRICTIKQILKFKNIINLDIKKDETDLEYSHRSAKELEDKIKKIGPENISGFVGETMLGGLVGDVPPTKYTGNLLEKFVINMTFI